MTEVEMCKLEDAFPYTAASTFRVARAESLAAGIRIVESLNGNLVITSPNGTTIPYRSDCKRRLPDILTSRRVGF